MALQEELSSEVAEIFRRVWSERDGQVVPEDENLQLGNDAVKLDATVLYADLADSTVLVDGHSAQFAAETYKAFLRCAAKIIRSESGAITAYDGDRIMAVFVGGTKNTRAVRSALKINFAVKRIIHPLQSKQYPSAGFTLKHVVGIDTSPLYVARTGIRGANDLVWVGRAANYAAKLAALPEKFATYITSEVHTQMLEVGRTTNGRQMWESVRWNTFDNRSIYRSNWWWPLPSDG